MTIPSPKTCRICGKPLTLHEQYAGPICSHWRCRWQELADALRDHRRQAAHALGEPAADSFPITVVPQRTFRQVPLSLERRRDFAHYLEERMREAPGIEPAAAAVSDVAGPVVPVQTPDPPAVSALLARICAVCGGFCCFYGGTRHAFLDSETLRRTAQAQTGIAAGDVPTQYLDHLPPLHFEGSCVYHTESGCALPRRMRAHICNAYECRGLTDARETAGAARHGRAFVVVRHDHRIIRSAFVDGSGIRAYTPGGDLGDRTD